MFGLCRGIFFHTGSRYPYIDKLRPKWSFFQTRTALAIDLGSPLNKAAAVRISCQRSLCCDKDKSKRVLQLPQTFQLKAKRSLSTVRAQVQKHFDRRAYVTFTKRHVFKPEHKLDRVPEDFTLIYVNALKNIIGPARVFFSVFALLTIGMASGTLFTRWNVLDSWEVYGLSGVCVVTLFLGILVNILSRYYLTRIYIHQDNKNFIGVYHTFLGKVKHMTYSTDDLTSIHPSKSNSQLHNKCNVNIKGKTFHFQASNFMLPKYYNIHLGQK